MLHPLHCKEASIMVLPGSAQRCSCSCMPKYAEITVMLLLATWLSQYSHKTRQDKNYTSSSQPG